MGQNARQSQAAEALGSRLGMLRDRTRYVSHLLQQSYCMFDWTCNTDFARLEDLHLYRGMLMKDMEFTDHTTSWNVG